ncbi:hypothetical protein M9Y10_000773 [Tritrichomonas musculus]|uniref:Uncharacterized protein n=1 Tax=Tritrichomonas musculus TaxID=1915356 RepID=A0ABR2L548_9EUKA
MLFYLLLAISLSNALVIKDGDTDPTESPKKPTISTTVWIIIVVVVIIVGSIIIALIIKYFWCNRFRSCHADYVAPEAA